MKLQDALKKMVEKRRGAPKEQATENSAAAPQTIADTGISVLNLLISQNGLVASQVVSETAVSAYLYGILVGLLYAAKRTNPNARLSERDVAILSKIFQAKILDELYGDIEFEQLTAEQKQELQQSVEYVNAIVSEILNPAVIAGAERDAQFMVETRKSLQEQ